MVKKEHEEYTVCIDGINGQSVGGKAKQTHNNSFIA